jgi:hypothetical protein
LPGLASCHDTSLYLLIGVGLCTLGEGPRGHEAPLHAAILELVPDGVRVIWAGFLKEPLEVVRRWPRLSLVTVSGSRDASHARAARLPVITDVRAGRSHGPLRALLASFFAALLSTVYGDVGGCLLAIARGHLLASPGLAKHNRLIASCVLCGNVTRLLE